MHAVKPVFHSFVLTELEKYQLKLLIEGFPKIDLSGGNVHEELRSIICYCSAYLPQRLLLFLLGFRANPNDDGVVLIQNLPVDTTNEWLLMLLMSSVADLVTEQGVSDEKYIWDLVHGFSRSFYSFEQDYVALLCLRHDHDPCAVTTVMSVVQALKKLDAKTIQILHESRYSNPYLHDLPVLSADLMYPALNVDLSTMCGKDQEAELALNAFRRVLNDSTIGHVLQAGEMLMLDTQIVSPSLRYDGQNQWLRCLSGVRDVRRGSFRKGFTFA